MKPLPARAGDTDDPIDEFWEDVTHVSWGAAAMIVFLILVAAYYLYPRDRSVMLEATTEELRVTGIDPEVTWSVADATLCREVQSRSPQNLSEPPPDATCGAFSAVEAGIERITWPKGSSVMLRRQGYGRLEIQVLEGPGGSARSRNRDALIALQPGDILVLAPDFSPLPITGYGIVGAASPAGPPLRSGSFEWRETLPFRDRPSIVGTGNLRAGDVVKVVRSNCGSAWPRPQSMLVIPTARDTPGMKVALTAARKVELTGAGKDRGPATNMGLCLSRLGFTDTFVKPRLIDRISSDPMILGLGAILSAAIAVFPAGRSLSELVALRRRRKTRLKGDSDKYEGKKESDPTSASEPGRPVSEAPE